MRLWRVVSLAVFCIIVTVSGIAARPASASMNVAQLSVGNATACAVTVEGGAYCWGANENGHLGTGRPTNSATPVSVMAMSSGVKQISVGLWHACAVTTGGAAKCWGDNSHGAIGNGVKTTVDVTTPVAVSTLSSGVKSVSAGYLQTCALMNAGSVKCWGFQGPSGSGSSADELSPVSVPGLASGVTQVETGGFFNCALVSATVKCWHGGQAPTAVPGLDSAVVRLVRDRSSWDEICGVTAAGSVKCVDSTGTARTVPGFESGVQSAFGGLMEDSPGVGFDVGGLCANFADGSLKCMGDNSGFRLGVNGDGSWGWQSTTAPSSFSPASSIELGSDFACALSQSGDVHCAGRNGEGELGDNTIVPPDGPPTYSLPSNVIWLAAAAPAPTVGQLSAGGSHACAVTSLPSLLCWGWNYTGQLGDSTRIDRSVPTDLIESPQFRDPIRSVSAGQFHTCAVSVNDSVYCWGFNNANQVRSGSTSNVLTASRTTTGMKTVTTGAFHTCAITTGDAAKCWGSNMYGQLGDGTTANASTPVGVIGLASGVRQMTAGNSYSCALMSYGGVVCWGDNSYGELGNGTTTSSNIPVSVTGLSSGVVAISSNAQGSHTCALTAGGAVRCWGANESGQIGNGTTESSLVPTTPVGLSSGVTSVSAGGEHTCAIAFGGTGFCWGSDSTGALADGATNQYPHPTPALTYISNALSVSAGGDFSCSVSILGLPSCWGAGGSGQLGRGNVEDSYTPLPVGRFN